MRLVPFKGVPLQVPAEAYEKTFEEIASGGDDLVQRGRVIFHHNVPVGLDLVDMRMSHEAAAKHIRQWPRASRSVAALWGLHCSNEVQQAVAAARQPRIAIRLTCDGAPSRPPCLRELKTRELHLIINIIPLLVGGQPADRALALLPALGSIQSLAVPEGITDAGLAHLRPLKGLRVLSATGAELSVAGLRHLLALPLLHSLSLSGTPLDDAGLKVVSGLRGLTGLDLSMTGVSDRSGAHLRALPRLEWLLLGGTNVSDRTMRVVGGLAALRRLQLTGTEITDSGLAHLAPLKNLELLDLSNTRITDRGIRHLTELPHLERLYLKDVALTDRSIAHLSRLATLKELDIEGSGITAAGKRRLKRAIKGLSVVDWKKLLR